MKVQRIAVALLLVVLSASFTWQAAAAAAAPTTKPAAPEVTLKPGDAAPGLFIAKWVKGEPVKELEKGKVYVVEFWATWCGPCIAAMPHVTELQKKYADKGVVVIGVNVWERDLSLVEPFVEKQGDRMGYRVAMEEREEGQPRGRMAFEWMQAAGRNGIPCSFLIDRSGRVAWIGHPMSLEGPLAKVVAGTFDIAAQAELEKAVEAQRQELYAAVRQKDFDKALGIIDKVTAMDAEAGKSMANLRVSYLFQKGDYAAGNAAAKAIAEKMEPGAGSTNAAASLAFTMLNAPDAAKVDVDLALKLATSAAGQMEKDGQDKFHTRDMLLARAHAAKGDFGKAAEHEQAYVDALPAGPQKAAEQKRLEEYKKKAGGAT